MGQRYALFKTLSVFYVHVSDALLLGLNLPTGISLFMAI